MRALITYYLVIGMGYFWGLVLIVVGQPFDAFVLLVVTASYNSYRNAIRAAVAELKKDLAKPMEAPHE